MPQASPPPARPPQRRRLRREISNTNLLQWDFVACGLTHEPSAPTAIWHAGLLTPSPRGAGGIIYRCGRSTQHASGVRVRAWKAANEGGLLCVGLPRSVGCNLSHKVGARSANHSGGLTVGAWALQSKPVCLREPKEGMPDHRPLGTWLSPDSRPRNEVVPQYDRCAPSARVLQQHFPTHHYVITM